MWVTGGRNQLRNTHRERRQRSISCTTYNVVDGNLDLSLVLGLGSPVVALNLGNLEAGLSGALAVLGGVWVALQERGKRHE
jgi:hypothetical protein